MTQQLVLEPLGIITEPNKLGNIPAGAFASMTNAVERSPGVIENMRAWETKVTLNQTHSPTTLPAFVVVPPGQKVLVFTKTATDTYYRWYDLATGAGFGAQQFLEISASLYGRHGVNTAQQPHFTYQVVGTQLFVNFYSMVFVWDYYDPPTTGDIFHRTAGLQPPGLGIVNSPAGTALKANTWAAWVAIVTRKINDREVVSAPSAAVYYAVNGPGPFNLTCRVYRNQFYKAGDTIEIYRTKSKPNGTSALYKDFQSGEEVGGEYQRCAAYVLTAADIAGPAFVEITDRTPDENLGESLYTNQARQGAGAAAFPPPAVEALINHKGYQFGFGPTYPATVTLRPQTFWGIINGGGVPITQSANSFGGTNITGATWSAGGTTVTVSPTSQLAAVSPGQQVFGTGISTSQVLSVGVSSFTLLNPAPGSGTSATIEVTDLFETAALGFSPNAAFLEEWRVFQGGAINITQYYHYAPALKLPPYTQSANQFVAQPTDGFSIRARYVDDARSALSVRSSKGDRWDPAIATLLAAPATQFFPEYQSQALTWSELNEPEAWPLVNKDFFSVGKFCAAAGTRDSIVAFYTDAIWRISGTGGTARDGYDWRGDPLLTGVTINGSQTICTLFDTVYAHTSEGLIAVDSSGGMKNITQGLVHDQLATPPWNDGPYTQSTAAFMVEDEENGEILLREPSAANGRMWLYNIHTQRLSQTISHEKPFHGGYSRYLRAPIVLGQDGSGAWTLKSPTGAYTNFSITYQPVYADNPFAQRQWQTLNVSAETSAATIATTFNATAGSTRAVGSDGRVGFEVPRNAPAVGNVLQVKLDVTTSVRTKLWGFALDYVDHTDQRRNR